ncbi:PREDICTED: 15-hydroxyprostaglandin dehydrogenase [NAD(+)]-like [Amphimedon queenslandica]|uniref:15-hydroxyprostaglandin dehydrogenase [NAD(+)] n=1 Tax=Amphimedon queenslandica TaxID=400682 RepID=A0A1X7TM79_AMPQE|nr:PREDICTED: 15-hydroxyprostaglandin dehydrogenase [NAD(+)]-like [Amphimedon queenslandica]|eukprot:XP_019858877.1 PREDICTED: 15-hydroxyprostaglandin dehydrogenase [NAD(+)]-like [Amphimedon queenslandica]
MSGRVSGLVALVTGAASGIGLATSRHLLKSGAKVGAIDISTNLKSTCDTLGKEFGSSNIAYLPCDVSDDDALKSAFKETKEQFGSLDIVVNNAGIFDEDNWGKLLKVNLQSVISGTYNAMELMSPDKGGVIVNTSSIAGLRPGTHLFCPAYSAAKSGIIAFTKAMKNNLELRGIKIRINSICPAGVETPLVLEAAKLFYSMPQPIIDAVTASSSTEVMKPEFIAEGIMELITDASKNGAILMAEPDKGFTYVEE